MKQTDGRFFPGHQVRRSTVHIVFIRKIPVSGAGSLHKEPLADSAGIDALLCIVFFIFLHDIEMEFREFHSLLHLSDLRLHRPSAVFKNRFFIQIAIFINIIFQIFQRDIQLNAELDRIQCPQLFGQIIPIVCFRIDPCGKKNVQFFVVAQGIDIHISQFCEFADAQIFSHRCLYTAAFQKSGKCLY